MSRWTDADALRDKLMNAIKCGYRADMPTGELEAVLNDVEQAPTIDLVRCAECKNCKRKRGTFKGEPIFFYRCEEHNRDVESDDYCSWGERRE